MTTVIDRSDKTSATFFVGDDTTDYIAQTFLAAGSALDSVTFFIDVTSGIDLGYRLLITTAAFAADGFHPGAVLFESGRLTAPLAGGFQEVTVATGKVHLTPGQTYAFIIDSFTDRDFQPTSAQLATSHDRSNGNDYTGGYIAGLDADLNANRGEHFLANWFDAAGSLGSDLSMRLVFSNPGVTITGTNGNDTIDATHGPNKQPKPGALDDTITGLKGNDKLSGLGGDDLLDGGKDKDKLTGGDGEDQFRFSVGANQPADKIMDFNPVDDTILLAVAKFKALALGVLSDAAFRDIGEASSPDDRIIYKASGKLLYDKDGPGGADAHAFVKLIGAPDISAADFLVV